MMKNSDIKGIIFDLDGTLIDTDELIIASYHEVFKELRPNYKLTKEEELSFLGPPLEEIFNKYFDEEFDVLVKIYRSYAEKHTIELAKVYPNTIELLTFLKSKGYKLGVVTSRFKKSALKMLTTFNIDSFFDCVIGLDDVSNPKPSPDGVLKCVESFNLSKEEVIFIGDAITDFQAGKNAGVKTGFVSFRENSNLDCDIKIESYQELLSFFKMIEKDVAIIGAGPGGITSSIYLKRAGIDFIMFENGLIGGKVNSTSKIDNYPPFENITGYELSQKYEKDLKYNDIKITREKVVEVIKKEDYFYVKTNKNIYKCKKVLIASGTNNKSLNFLNEEKYIGKGISFCAVCDGNLYKNKVVAVVGGGNSALEECLYLSNIASKVYLINRRNEFRGAKQYLDSIKEKDNIEIFTPFVIDECIGNEAIESLKIHNVENNEAKSLQINALFEYVGLKANSDYLLIEEVKDENGFIVVDNECQTKVDGLFAIGDVTNRKLRQIIVASSDGAIVSQTIINSLRKK